MANKNAKPKNPRVRAIVSLVAILVVVAICGYVALFGIGKGTMILSASVLTCAAACIPSTRPRMTAASASMRR